ncbi:CdaR family transcriptional regulator [Salinispira pacifica]
MLNARLAADLVDRLSAHIDFNINIMDDRGVIIASRDRSRIGDFHAAAHRIVTDGGAIEVLHADDSLPPGVKPGVNLPIVHHGRTVGVVGITGDPRDVLNLAFAIKTSVESIYEYEMYKEKMSRRQGIKNLFQNMLLYNEGFSTTEGGASDLDSVARKLGYSAELSRVPVLIRPAEELDVDELRAIVKRIDLHSRQDISFVTITHDLLVFKTVDLKAGGVVATVRRTVSEYVAQLRKAVSASTAAPAGQRPAFSVYVGSVQRDFRHYRQAFVHAQWLVNQSDGSAETLYFNDFVYHYIRSTIPGSVFENIFAPLVDRPVDAADPTVSTTIDALLRANMSIKLAADMLGVHRNTLRARLERIGHRFGIDPAGSASDREFLMCLNEYLKISSSSFRP